MRAFTYRILTMILAAAVTLGGCGKGVDPAAETAALMQTSRDWSRTAETGDAERILAVWADDATLILPGQPPLHGKAAIRAYIAQSLKVPGFRIRWEPVSGQVSGDFGTLVERTFVTADDPSGHPTTETLNSVTVWRRQPDGRWRNIIDISTPAAAPGSG